MNIDSLRQVIADSLLVEMQKSGDIYKTILTEQHETYELIVYIWIAITAILISGTMFWNFFLTSKKIKSEIEEKESQLSNKMDALIEKKINAITETQNQFQSQISKKLESNQKENTELISKQFEENGVDIDQKFNILSAESSRIFGNSAKENNFIWLTVTHYGRAIRLYEKCKHYDMVNVCLDQLINCLTNDQCKIQYKDHDDSENDEEINAIIKTINSLPGYVQDKKVKIIKLLKSFKE